MTGPDEWCTADVALDSDQELIPGPYLTAGEHYRVTGTWTPGEPAKVNYRPVSHVVAREGDEAISGDVLRSDVDQMGDGAAR